MSNGKRERVAPGDELRVLIATDVLSEGQNLQDCATIVNYDLPWAIIRLIQRAGRVDRIGQRADTIRCYSFLPADGVEQLLRLRARVRVRLRENAEVVGTDEAFFEDEANDAPMILDIYNERAGIFDGPKLYVVRGYLSMMFALIITVLPRLDFQPRGRYLPKSRCVRRC
ncbi:MAG TPA: C-terminal helicase domain-containing protein [Ktedonobacterales bacterium]|nr:C-terminal helicase domain-containing protein [Ktedonobacterales bacterium]